MHEYFEKINKIWTSTRYKNYVKFSEAFYRKVKKKKRSQEKEIGNRKQEIDAKFVSVNNHKPRNDIDCQVYL